LTAKLQLILLISVSPLAAQDKNIDVRRSTITIHVGKAGIFSGAGHTHEVSAPIASGVFNDLSAPRVEFKVDAAKMEVKPDSKLSSQDQAQVQRDMQEKVLESAKYPEIMFRSSRAETSATGQWRVEGTLSLHGVSRPVSMNVQRNGEAYTGRVVIRQTDFGIKPITVAGGTVKVKNELEIAFQIIPVGSVAGRSTAAR